MHNISGTYSLKVLFSSHLYDLASQYRQTGQNAIHSTVYSDTDSRNTINNLQILSSKQLEAIRRRQQARQARQMDEQHKNIMPPIPSIVTV